MNNLNEMNSKLYEENQQYKERTCDQRQQIDNFHILFQENKQENERAISVLRKELDEVLKRESMEKRRIQSSFEAKQQEAMQIVASLRANVEEMREREARLGAELQQERNKNELAEKKCKLVEKDVALLREAGELERREWEAYRKQAVQEAEVGSICRLIG